MLFGPPFVGIAYIDCALLPWWGAESRWRRNRYFKPSYFYSPSVILLHSQYIVVAFVSSLGLMEYWRNNENFTFSFNLWLYFFSCIGNIILQHLFLMIAIISMLDAAHITINNNNKVAHHRFLKEGDTVCLAKTLDSFSRAAALREQSGSWELKEARKASPANTSWQVHSLPVTSHSQQLPSCCCPTNFPKTEHLYQVKLFHSAGICCSLVVFWICLLITRKHTTMVDDPCRISTTTNNDAAVIWSLWWKMACAH